MRSNREETDSSGLTRGLLICGISLGPLFYVVAIFQFFTRAGFDIRRHPISLLSLGDLGWVQVANFIITGLLGVACAIGIRRVLAGRKGGTWGPLLVALFGLGMLLAGIFPPDPAYGFPPGSQGGTAGAMSGHAMMHGVGFLIAFISLIAASFVSLRHFLTKGRQSWGIYSAVSGAVTPVLIISGFAVAGWTSLAFAVAGVVAFGWLSAASARLLAEVKIATKEVRS